MQRLQICIGPTIRIGRESWCLPYAGFFIITLFTLNKFEKEYGNKYCLSQNWLKHKKTLTWVQPENTTIDTRNTDNSFPAWKLEEIKKNTLNFVCWTCQYKILSHICLVMLEPSKTICCSSRFGEEWHISFCSKYVIDNTEMSPLKLINVGSFQFRVNWQTYLSEWPIVLTIYSAAAGPSWLFPSKICRTSGRSRTVKS